MGHVLVRSHEVSHREAGMEKVGVICWSSVPGCVDTVI